MRGFLQHVSTANHNNSVLGERQTTASYPRLLFENKAAAASIRELRNPLTLRRMIHSDSGRCGSNDAAVCSMNQALHTAH